MGYWRKETKPLMVLTAPYTLAKYCIGNLAISKAETIMTDESMIQSGSGSDVAKV